MKRMCACVGIGAPRLTGGQTNQSGPPIMMRFAAEPPTTHYSNQQPSILYLLFHDSVDNQRIHVTNYALLHSFVLLAS